MSETLRCEVLLSHVRTVDGIENVMFEPMLSGVVTVPRDELTSGLIDNGYLKEVQEEAAATGPTRAEHLAWCKERALMYVEAGNLQDAFGSMSSDLGKHPETAKHPALELMMSLYLNGHLSTEGEMRRFINGFN